MHATEKRQRISVDRLVPGLFVDIELPWNRHPFLMSRFRIKTQQQIDVIRDLGLKSILVNLERSAPGVLPAPEPPAAAAPAVPAEMPSAAASSLWQDKKARIDRADQFRERHANRSQQYNQTAREAKQLMRDLDTRPANAVQSANQMVDSMTDAFSQDRDVIMNLITLQGDEQGMYHHSLNVLVLSMLLGASAGFSKDELRVLGLGALLHDIGKVRVPSQILMKTTPLKGPEQALYQMHARYGSEISQKIGELPPTVLDIIHHHHELLDGSGYPDGLLGVQISRAVRIVALANLYDNLCNPPNIADAMIPKVAMSTLFTRYKGKLDPELVALFIRTLGVFPPGTVVRLSDGSIGMVIAVDSKELLKPEILLYHAEVPKKEALIVDLRNEDLSIETALTPGQYPTEVLEYLGVRSRAGYFFERHG
jgi:putative nucleotidyltransferase with HDIG domain